MYSGSDSAKLDQFIDLESELPNNASVLSLVCNFLTTCYL